MNTDALSSIRRDTNLTMWERGQKWREQYMKEKQMERDIKEGRKVSAKSVRKSKRLAEYRAKLMRKQEAEAKAKVREDRMVYMRVEGRKTLEQIAQIEGISRERVRQILGWAAEHRGIDIPKKFVTRKPDVITTCGYPLCNVEIIRKGCMFQGHGNHYCFRHRSKAKSSRYVEANPKWAFLTPRERQKWKYDNDPAFRQRLRIAQKKWLTKIKADPEKYRRYLKLQRACSDRWQAKQKKRP